MRDRVPASTHRNRSRLLPLLALTLAAATAATGAAAETAHLRLASDGLPPLGHGFVYEGWLIVDGEPVTTGTFQVAADGSLTETDFTAEVSSTGAIGAFVLTIEPSPDPDPAPSAVHLLAGDFSAGAAFATVGHAAAIGSDFTSASGAYILAAPSAGDGGDHRNGIWWLDPSGPSPTLELPGLPAGWVYEGWVAGPDGPVSTGRFHDVAAADSDGPGFHSGPHGAPPFPGQDFVTPPTDLTVGHMAVISVEPVPDDSPAPFVLKPLVDPSIDDVGMGTLQPMSNSTSGFPTLAVQLLDVPAAMEMAHLDLRLHGLEDLGPDAAYEGWLVVDGMPVSTGVFTVDADGVQSQTYFPTMVPSLEAVSAFVLTIEPVPDADPAPAATHVLAGDFVGHRAPLGVGHHAALGTDFATASGAYILAAPSAGDGGDYRNGIWWLDPAGPSPTLDLPDLPEGWVWEGWVAGADGPVSTGRFTSVSGADSDGAGPAAGQMDTPPFPGQDFVDPAKDLTAGYAAVLSVEPEPDNSPAPFVLKPLMDPRIDDVGMGVLQPMHRNPSAMPTGRATLMQGVMIPAGGGVEGVGGVQWQTDVDADNRGLMPATVLLQLLASDRGNAQPETHELTIAPGSTVRWHDVFGTVFGFEGTGALRVLVGSADVRVDSRTYADTPDGTYGQGIGPHTGADAIRYGQPARLLQLSQGPAFRTNAGFVNLTGGQAVVEYALLDGDGAVVAHETVTLRPFEHAQLNRVFPSPVEVGSATVRVLTPGGAVLAYGSVVDNPTDDPTFIRAQ